MLRLIKAGLVVLLMAMSSQRPAAFSLLGPFEEWQVFEIGYNLPSDIGAVKNLGEEYRWNIPTVTYAYDPSFLDYFGEDGVRAVEAAIEILNDLPRVSKMSSDLSEFPLDTRRFNYQATALGLLDLKSYALSTLLEEMGLAAPERYVWTLRSRFVEDEIPFYTVIKRNFDPITWEPSSYVNGTLYTYQIFQTWADPVAWEPVEFAVDPLAPVGTSVAFLSGIGGGVVDFRAFTTVSPGMFYTGLTRDDVGGLRYIYRRNNYNVEPLPAVATNATLTSTSPWEPIGGGTNNFTNVVNVALRPGIEKVRFQRVHFDSLLGQFVATTNSYTDRYLTNGVIREQNLRYVVAQPQVLFAAADLGVDLDGDPFLMSRTIAFRDHDTLNGSTTLGGPGTMQPPVEIIFSKIGPFFQNVRETNEEAAFQGFTWGSFDGSTAEPIVFPSGTSIRELERKVLGFQAESTTDSPWTIAPFISPGTVTVGAGGGAGGAGGGAGGAGGSAP